MPYFSDSTIYFEAIANDPWSFYLDSGIHNDLDENISEKSRYDIIVSDPFIKIVADENTVCIEESNQKETLKENAFDVLAKILTRFKVQDSSLPFAGGALGYFSYELGQSHFKINKDHIGIPQMMVGIYDWALIVDHQEKKTWIVSHFQNKWSYLKNKAKK